MSNKGYIALHRKLQDHAFWKEKRKFSRAEAWIDILMEAQHDDNPHNVLIGDSILVCNRGESLKSLDTWASRWGWNKSSVRRFIDLLNRLEMITYFGETKTTRLKVCNYDTYNPKRNASETIVKRSRHAFDTHSTPDKNVNNVENENTYCSEASRMPSKPAESEGTSNDTYNEPLSEQDHEQEYVSREEYRTEGENASSMLSPPAGEKTVEPPRQRLSSSSGTGNVVLSFPCVGQVKEWQLMESKLSEWNESYSGAVDVLSECRKARQWLKDNPARRKTANGMTRFLGAWLSRAVNSNRCRVGAGPMEVA